MFKLWRERGIRLALKQRHKLTRKWLILIIREIKKLLRRRRRQHRLKLNLHFTYESRETLKSFTLFITFKPITKLNLGHRNKFEIEF